MAVAREAAAPIYGLRGFTHGWALTLTVLSPGGARAADARLGEPEGVTRYARDGHLTLYHEQRTGAIDGLIERHGIVVVDKQDWDALKARHGERVYR